MIKIRVPGSFSRGIAFLDLETVKVPTPEGFRMPNGEALKRRWSIAYAGIALDGGISILTTLAEIGEVLSGADSVVYGATREFDEMICRGRFTNARRAHLPVPTFPAVPGAESFAWENIKTAKSDAYRSFDIASRDVPDAIAKGRIDIVLIHLLRDVADLILTAGAPDATCREWCERILRDNAFAGSLL